MRKTKIICTIGPASEDPAVFKEMCLHGLNVARLNFSHGSHPEHQKKIDMIKKVREELNLPIAIMLDTKGPEYRLGTFRGGSAELKEGSLFRVERGVYSDKEYESELAIISKQYPYAVFTSLHYD